MPWTLPASEVNWEMNPDHSYLDFELPYLVVSKVRGRFNSFTSFYDNKSLLITIKSNSINTENKIRDGHLREKDFFHVKKYPIITVKIKNVHEKPMTGILIFRNIEKEIRIQSEITKIKRDTWNKSNVFIKIKAVLSLQGLGIKWNKTLPENNFVLGDQVSVSAVLQFQPKAEMTSGFKYKIPDTDYIRMREKVQRGELEVLNTPPKYFKEVSIPIKKNPIEVLSNNQEDQSEESEKTWLFYLSLFYASFMTFLALLIISFYIKKHLLEANIFKSIKYIGFYSDCICLGLAFLFALSLGVIWSSF